ncbi:MAG: tRNA (adenosine(37)-N6)-dimethylallyltransferase MiaA [Opitutales bacterium]
MPHRPPIYVLTGPTAVGKTALALRWAAALDAEIVSCDAFQLYRGMDIGTAKPSIVERATLPHHLIDVAEVDEPMDVVRYTELAHTAVTDIQARGRNVLVTGGSGFYLKTYFTAVADAVDVTCAARDEAWALFEQGLEPMLTRLRTLNPEGLGELHTKNPRRVWKALERCLSTGLSLADLNARHAALPGAFDAWEKRTVLLMRSAETLWPRIQARTRTMLDAGLVAEVQTLRIAGLERNRSAADAIGYRETRAFLDAYPDPSTAPTEAVEALANDISIHTRQLAAKQKKWFRHQLAPDLVVNLDTVSEDDALAIMPNELSGLKSKD